MITILLSSLHPREGQIIQTAFEQFGYEIVDVTLNFENYLKCLKVKPTIFLIDIVNQCEKEMKIIQSIRNQPTHKDLIFLGFGPKDIAQNSIAFKDSLLDHYFARPLKFSEILKHIKKMLPSEADEIEANVQAIREQTDVDVIRDIKILPSTKLKMIVQHSSQFLAFPFTLPKILAITNDPGSGAAELAKMIETDPVVSAKILKTANTIFYSARDHRVTKMRDAIVRIGFNETKRVIICIETMKLFEDKQRNFGFNRKLFWVHSIGVAITTELLFTKGEYRQLAEHAFLAGLLHDLGTIVLDEFLPEIFCDALEKTASVSADFSTVFGEEFGFFPYMIAKAFMEEWNFHKLITEGINYKNVVSVNDINSSTEVHLQKALYLAHMLVKSHLIGRSCDQVINEVPNHILEELKLPQGITSQMIDQIYFKVNELCRFLNIEPIQHRPEEVTVVSDDRPVIYYFSNPGELFSPHLQHLSILPINVRRVTSLESLLQRKDEASLVVLSLDDSSDESISELLSSAEFFALSEQNCLLISSRVEYVLPKVATPHTSVIPREIDARLYGRIITAYCERK